jgi:hypothetical protein
VLHACAGVQCSAVSCRKCSVWCCAAAVNISCRAA